MGLGYLDTTQTSELDTEYLIRLASMDCEKTVLHWFWVSCSSTSFLANWTLYIYRGPLSARFHLRCSFMGFIYNDH